jgi:NADH-quinone oxidoreductase subunit G
VRFGQDIAGIQELGTTGRGENMEIGTYIERSVDHELSGNIIDLCPVGALNSKPFRFHARAWEMTQHPLVSPHDGMGSNLYGHVLRGKLMRIVPRPCEAINETWISDRDRFSYEGVYSDDRVVHPLVREANGSWRETDWEAALNTAAAGLRGAQKPGILAHPSSTLEEFHLLSRLAEGLGTDHIDHRLRQRDFRDQGSDALHPQLGLGIAEVEQLESLWLIGCNLRAELPMLAHRVRKAALRGARVSLLNGAAYDLLFPATQLVVDPARWVTTLAGVLNAALAGAAPPPALATLLAGVPADAEQRALAESLRKGQGRAIWLGALALRHPDFATLRLLARELARLSGATFGELAEGGNAAGAYLAGAIPHRTAAGMPRPHVGMDARAMLQKPLDSYLLFGTEPWSDSLEPAALQTLKSARFVLGITPFAGEALRSVAHVILPMGTFAETSGTYVNLEGRWQSFGGAARALGEARPGWKILRVLGNALGFAGFDYQSSEQVLEELRALVQRAPKSGYDGSFQAQAPAGHEAVIDVPMYQIDPLVRRAPSLQQTAIALRGGSRAAVR